MAVALRRQPVSWSARTLLTILVLAFAACSGGDDDDDDVVNPPPPRCIVSAVNLSTSNTTIEVGATTPLSAVLTTNPNPCPPPAPTVGWSSSDESIATVSTVGLVTGVSVGTATITGRAIDANGTPLEARGDLAIQVLRSAVASIEISPPQSTIVFPGTVQLTAVVRDSRNIALTGRTISWLSLATTVVSVNPTTGLVSAVGPGSGVIEATSESIKKTATVIVTIEPRTVTVALASPSVIVGQNTQATAVVRDALGSQLPGQAVSWSSSNPAIATVHPVSGLVTGITNGGPVSITARVNGFESVTGSATLIVGTAFAIANIDNPATSTNSASGFNSSGGAIVFTRTGTGLSRLTFNGLGRGGIGTSFGVLVNAQSATSNATLTTPTALCNGVSVTTTLPLTLEVRCEDPVTAAPRDASFRALVVGNNSLVTGVPSAFTTHTNLTATAPYTAAADLSFNTASGPMLIIPDAGGGTFGGLEIGHSQGVAFRNESAMMTSAFTSLPGVACITQDDDFPRINTVCFSRTGGPINAQHTLLSAARGRPGLPAAHAFVLGTGEFQADFSFTTGNTITATRTAAGRYSVTFSGVDGTPRPTGIHVTPFNTGTWRQCNHFVAALNPMTVDVACFDGNGVFTDTRFGLYLVQ